MTTVLNYVLVRFGKKNPGGFKLIMTVSADFRKDR